jgi:hypothetical protein
MERAEIPVTPNADVSPSVRAQLLATEHWSLLASRSTTQNELLVRIAIFLTLVSASIVSLALVGQATDFDGRFDVFAIVLFSILLLVGTLTLLRVSNGSDEDLAYRNRDEQASGCLRRAGCRNRPVLHRVQAR